MSPANIQERKLELIQWLSVVDDVSVIERLTELKEEITKDWWDDISESEKESIAKGLEDADSGRVKPHSDARAIYEKRL